LAAGARHPQSGRALRLPLARFFFLSFTFLFFLFSWECARRALAWAEEGGGGLGILGHSAPRFLKKRRASGGTTAQGGGGVVPSGGLARAPEVLPPRSFG